ncbi:MAG: flagellar hook-length control protein FliK [Hyphomonas sp.]|nr:flagellar hook-length control protein FliK [Hyphomonas sp.]
MAIALESDFRSLKTAQAAEPAERRPANQGRGEAFASSLSKARDAEPGEAGLAPQDAAHVVLALSLPPAEPTLETAQSASVAIADPIAAPEQEVAVVDATAAPSLLSEQSGLQAGSDELLSEIVLDRELVRESVKAEASLPPGAPASPDVGLPVAEPARPKLAVPEGAPAAPQQAPFAPAGAVPTGISPDPSPPPKTDAAALAAAVVSTASKSGADPEPTQVATIEGGQASVAKAEPKALTRAEQPLETSPAPAQSQLNTITPSTGSGAETTLSTSSPGTQTAGTTLISAVSPAAAQMAVPVAPSLPVAPVLAVLTASPAQIVDIVAQSAGDGQSDRIVVQLDPPELGRVSIDFKFDAQGLQHITITSETPEAMRQLRQMHSELVQALERQGIGSQNMSFQHQQQSAQHVPAPQNPFARESALADAASGLAPGTLLTADHNSTPRTPPGGRLDIRL